MSESTSTNRDQRFFGALLMSVGGLIATLCGLCSLGVLATLTWGLVDYLNHGGPLGPAVLLTGITAVVTLVVFGGVPTILGMLVFRAGLRRYGSRPKAADISVTE